MRTDEQRRNDIRDNLLIDMANALRLLLLENRGPGSAHFSGRLESHIQFLQKELI